MEGDKPLMHSGDEALIKAAATGEGAIPLTPDLLRDIGEALEKRKQEIDETHPKLVEECAYETRLAITAWVFKNLVEHAEQGGTWRYLIYERLGFEPDAYAVLQWAGGLTIHNEFDLTGNK